MISKNEKKVSNFIEDVCQEVQCALSFTDHIGVKEGIGTKVYIQVCRQVAQQLWLTLKPGDIDVSKEKQL